MEARIQIIGMEWGWVRAEGGEPTSDIVLPSGASLEPYDPVFVGANDAFGMYEIDNPALSSEEIAEAKRRERKADLLYWADHYDQMALDALSYDADGLLDAKMRQRRHDQYEAMAQAKKKEADAL